jgi:DNA-binding XRE family transcriptional regulator
MPAKSYAQELVRQRTGRDVEELLRELYVDKKHSQEQIAKALGVSRGAIVAWLTEFGISRDDREQLMPMVDVA